jgi:hypothetical protein
MKKVNCTQTQCIFNVLGGCRACKQCGCEPNAIDENCDVCWNCAHDLGILRWEDGGNIEEKQKEIEKPIEEKPVELKIREKYK